MYAIYCCQVQTKLIYYIMIKLSDAKNINWKSIQLLTSYQVNIESCQPNSKGWLISAEGLRLLTPQGNNLLRVDNLKVIIIQSRTDWSVGSFVDLIYIVMLLWLGPNDLFRWNSSSNRQKQKGARMRKNVHGVVLGFTMMKLFLILVLCFGDAIRCHWYSFTCGWKYKLKKVYRNFR